MPLDDFSPSKVQTPTVLPSAPRQVLGSPAGTVWLARLLTLAIFVAAPVLFARLVLVIAWFVAGNTTTGQIYDTHESHGKHTSYEAKFVYTAPDGQQTDEGSLEYKDFQALNAQLVRGPVSAKVRFITFASFHIAGLPDYNEPLWKLLQAVFFLGLTGIFAMLSFYGGFVNPAREKALLREGVPVLGAVTDKKTIKAKSTIYRIHYAFNDAQGKPVERTVDLDKKLFEIVQIGEVVTVLLDPQRPKRSQVYELSNYHVEGAIKS